MDPLHISSLIFVFDGLSARFLWIPQNKCVSPSFFCRFRLSRLFEQESMEVSSEESGSSSIWEPETLLHTQSTSTYWDKPIGEKQSPGLMAVPTLQDSHSRQLVPRLECSPCDCNQPACLFQTQPTGKGVAPAHVTECLRCQGGRPATRTVAEHLSSLILLLLSAPTHPNLKGVWAQGTLEGKVDGIACWYTVLHSH